MTPSKWFSYSFIPASFKNIYSRADSSVRKFFIEEQHLTLVTDLTQSEDSILKRLSSTVRNEIRRNCSLTFSTRNTSKDLIAFYDAFAETKKINKIGKRVWKYPSSNIIWTVAEFDGQLLAAHAYIVYNKHVRLLYSGNARFLLDDNKPKNLIPLANKQLHWHDLIYFKDKGYQTYDWGGIDDILYPGVATFKRSFGGQDTIVYTYISRPLHLINLLVQWFSRSKVGIK